MRLHLGLVLFFSLMISSVAGAQEKLAPGATAIASSQTGKVFLLMPGKSGSVLVVENGKAVPFAEGFDDPRGLIAHLDGLFVVGRDRIWHADAAGKVTTHLTANQFPRPPVSLQHAVADAKTGTLFVSDAGDRSGRGAAVFLVNGMDKSVTILTDASKIPDLKSPHRLLRDGASRLFVADPGAGRLFYVNTTTGAAEADFAGLNQAGRVVWDYHGRLYASTNDGLVVVPPQTKTPVTIPETLPNNADLCIEPEGHNLLVLDPKSGSVTRIATQVPGMEVDTTPLPVRTAPAFPDLEWTGWSPEDDSGRPTPFRPILLTHAGDGTSRVFVATQQGVIHVFQPQDQKTKVFLDITSRVHINLETENEQGLLGLAFHPRYKTNGEFFVFYTRAENKSINVISRFKVDRNDSGKGDAGSEEVLLEIERPFWNRNGGTLVFGPDGFLYAVVGDGGNPGSPMAQNLGSLLGKVLRIDIDKKEAGKNYAIPRDNPFVNVPDARPEVWAYGIRNSWRISFDRSTGLLYGGENGHDFFDATLLIKKGGNYGWNHRESFHPFSPSATVTKDMVDPIWEYTRPLGFATIGGGVYRGRDIPELDGYFLYGDYITNRLWGLRYDQEKGRVVANRPIPKHPTVFISFGTDEQGEMYLVAESSTGRGIHRFAPAEEGAE